MFNIQWITRERPKIDWIACPWLIKRFVDSNAEFIYVPKDQVLDKAKDIGAIPYDITGAEYPITPTSVHLISFLKNISCLTPLFFNGKIVRGADTDRFDLAPQAAL